MTTTYETSSQVEPLQRAARTVDRWGLVAGVTGFLANVLLAVLFTTPADGSYAWTGQANDSIGVVTLLAIIPVVAGLLTVCGDRPGLGAITALAIVTLAAMAAVELVFVLGLVPFPAEADSSYAGLIVVFGWLLAVSRSGRIRPAAPPRRRQRCRTGRAGLAGAGCSRRRWPHRTIHWRMPSPSAPERWSAGRRTRPSRSG